ncbi:hypothetical protein RO3G_01445 [Lichtheimia corymbifera JMRC:FSU:9682]|uniref:protein-tyrosine-phosphatase n=1 Tax=Lichtheimia corymbifera JMRC:FSU:9682 TaxID=1263082 RepID=A0A068RWQ1_9FUNG|nr:hypothetical protein RO3G_01445 [Lichtheimia corymbifera JMRC:FSU:9682]
MSAPLATTSTPVLASPRQQRPFSFAASASSSSSLASRRRNNKNLSLCLSSSSNPLLTAPATPHKMEFETSHYDPYQHGPSRILPQLYLGAERNTLDLEMLRQLSVQCMLNVAEEVVHPQEQQFTTFEEILERPPLPSPSLSRTSTASSIASSLHTIATNVFDMSPSSPRFFFDNNNNSTTSPTRFHQQSFVYKKIPWKHNQDNLVHELDAAIAAIDQARDAGYTILVHCQCGVARSATVVIAYIMTRLQLPMQEAYDYVKVRAPGINPNLSLLYQLHEYEKKLQQPPSTPHSTANFIHHHHDSNNTNNNNHAAPASPKKMFHFRKSSLSLSWKRRMSKTSKMLSPPGKEELPATPGLTRC